MANLVITARCNRNCSYCFAMDSLDQLNERTARLDDLKNVSQQDPGAMSMTTFRKTLDWLDRSGITEVRLLGGEPTLHPEFNTMVDEALSRDFKVVVFSGGLIPGKVLDKLQTVEPRRLLVLLNVVRPDENQPAQWKKQQAVMQRLGPRLALGINIDRPGVDLDFLIPLISEYDLAKSVRLGIAHPDLQTSNTYLHPRHYPEVGQRVTAFALAARARQIQLEFDCGWVPCMFPPEAFALLGKTPRDIGQRCNPILDILPTGEVVSCFPLYDHHKESMEHHVDSSGLRQAFCQRQQQERAATLYRACRGCHWKAQGACSGGCLSASMRRQRTATFNTPWPVKALKR